MVCVFLYYLFFPCEVLFDTPGDLHCYFVSSYAGAIIRQACFTIEVRAEYLQGSQQHHFVLAIWIISGRSDVLYILIRLDDRPMSGGGTNVADNVLQGL